MQRTIRVRLLIHEVANAPISGDFAACAARLSRSRMRPMRQRVVEMDAKRIDELARRLAEALPEGISDLRTDMERNFRSVLQGTLARMDVVTREEFDVQAGVLARTRERVEQLLERLEELERGLQKAATGKPASGKKTAGSPARKKKPAAKPD